MKFPKTAKDVEPEIYISSDKFEHIGDLRVRQILKILPKVPNEIIIEGIIKVFEKKERGDKSFQDQEIAGDILLNINPKTSDESSSLLKRVLQNWNKSIGQLPLWFKENYGLKEMHKTIQDLAKSNISEIEKDKLKTIAWWMGIKKLI